MSHNLHKVLHHIRSTSKNTREQGARFEKLISLFLKTDSIYKNEFKKVWLWKSYPDRKHRDLGVDLVAEKHTGEKVAIQCKFFFRNNIFK